MDLPGWIRAVLLCCFSHWRIQSDFLVGSDRMRQHNCFTASARFGGYGGVRHHRCSGNRGPHGSRADMFTVVLFAAFLSILWNSTKTALANCGSCRS